MKGNKFDEISFVRRRSFKIAYLLNMTPASKSALALGCFGISTAAAAEAAGFAAFSFFALGAAAFLGAIIEMR